MCVEIWLYLVHLSQIFLAGVTADSLSEGADAHNGRHAENFLLSGTEGMLLQVLHFQLFLN